MAPHSNLWRKIPARIGYVPFIERVPEMSKKLVYVMVSSNFWFGTKNLLNEEQQIDIIPQVKED